MYFNVAKMSHHLAIKKKGVINKNCSIITFQLDGQACEGGRRLCAESSQRELTGRLFSSPGFLGENQRPPQRCQQLHHTRWKGKDPARLFEKHFSASIYRKSFLSPSARVEEPPWEGCVGLGRGCSCVCFPGVLVRDPECFSRSFSRTL